MIIFCAICHHGIHSKETKSEDAQKDILEQMSNHLHAHPKEAEALAEKVHLTQALLSSYILMKDCVHIPDGEKEILASYDLCEEILLSVFDLCPIPTPSAASIESAKQRKN
jgi:hypothetical protein